MRPGGQYAKGANRERQRVAWHYREGALWASRTAGSHSAFDVVAVYDNRVELEQIKSGRTPTPEDRAEFSEAVERLTKANVVMTLLWWPDREEPRTVHVSLPAARRKGRG